MAKLKTIYLGVAILLLAAGCKKNNTQNTSPEDVFPNSVGDSWHYLVTDTTIQGNLDSGSTQYTVDVLIVGTVKWNNGITAAIWQYNYPGWTDSNYVFQSGDTFRFMDRTNTNIVRQYIVPFVTGSSWPYVPGINNVTVTGQSNVAIGNNIYTNSWQIYGSAGMPDASFTIDQWFKDSVGFVKLYLNPSGELIITKHIQEWSLVNYELN
jgi:hypothetical protein